MSTKTKTTEAKFVKNFLGNDEAKAKSQAAKKLGVPKKLLKANHTNKLFVFTRR